MATLNVTIESPQNFTGGAHTVSCTYTNDSVESDIAGLVAAALNADSTLSSKNIWATNNGKVVKMNYPGPEFSLPLEVTVDTTNGDGSAVPNQFRFKQKARRGANVIEYVVYKI
ncbi:MAG TPA: hypothetical protein V6C97_09580 [Oculatellaceae cyanobacterium]